MNYHTAKMVAAKNGAKCIRDEAEHCYHFEDSQGSELFTLRYDTLRDMTTLELENRLAQTRQEAR